MRSYFCSSFGTASYLYVSEKILSLGEGLASSAFGGNTSQRVAYGNRSQPSVYLYEGDKFAPKKKGLSCSGILPSPMRFISLVSDFRKLSSALQFDLLTRSLKISGTILSGPAADPFGKDIITLYRSKPVTKKLFKFCGFGAANLAC